MYAVDPPSLTSAVTATVAVFVAIISYRQWKTAHEKLKLELYNRRLELYQSFLALEDVLAGWSGTAAEEEILIKFKRANRESKFLFPPESEVPTVFSRYGNTVINITSFKNFEPYFKDENPNADWRQFRVDAYNQAINLRFILEARIAPFLEFHSSSDPLGWLRRHRARTRMRKSLLETASRSEEFITKLGSERRDRGERPLS